MHINEKEQELMDILAQANTILSVHQLADKLFVSPPTIRRYLTNLSDKGLVVRTHGGAMINYLNALNKNIPMYSRLTAMSKEKNEIAKKASKVIKYGSVVFLDASSTVFHLIPYLKDSDLIICTNSIKTAMSLSEMNIRCTCFGGEVHPSTLSCNSQETFEMIKKFNADYFFFSCDALSDDGILSDNSRESSYLRAQYMKYAKTKVLLIDSTKLHKKCWNTLCKIEDIDYCFSDTELPSNIYKRLKNKPDTD